MDQPSECSYNVGSHKFRKIGQLYASFLANVVSYDVSKYIRI